MKQSMKALLVAGVLGVSATACMTHAADTFTGVTYGNGTITITHGGTSITMEDKNLGASTSIPAAGGDTSTDLYGNYYQWGGTTPYAYSTEAAEGFDSSRTSDGWTEATDPCKSGYHVPTLEEWNNVLSMYEAEGNRKDTFKQAFKIPFAGWRDSRNAKMDDAGERAELWSASPNDGLGVYDLTVDDIDARVSRYPSSVALPVRCFANSSSPSSSDLSAETEIILTIEEGQLSIGTDGEESVTLTGSMAASLESKTVEKSLEKLFRVEDLKGSSKGYRTTISVTDMTGSVENVVYTIPAANIYLKATNLVKESGTGEDVVLTSSLSDFRSMEEPVTFIQRGTGTTAGLLGKYGARPELKVVVPANMPGTTYKGTITYTLYENE